MEQPATVLELFAGVGGAAIAFGEKVKITAAVDINQNAQTVYKANFDHPYLLKSIESMSANEFAIFDADIWWLSPPCQPFTRRGNQNDHLDPRSAALKNIAGIFEHELEFPFPRHMFLENVAGFQESQMRRLLLSGLKKNYRVDEFGLCPTQFGIPNNRPRYYLVATRNDIPDRAPFQVEKRKPPMHSIHNFVEMECNSDEQLILDSKVLTKYANSINVVKNDSNSSICFTSGYGKSITLSGSYLCTDEDSVRRFSPKEIIKFLGFPPWFQLPGQLSNRQLWKLVGNSISVTAAH